MDIIPYKQTLSHSCLAACLLMLRNRQFSEQDEQNLALSGSQRIHQFYVTGIPLEFVKTYNTKIRVYVDNNYFTHILKDTFYHERKIGLVQNKITLSLIKKLLNTGLLICHIDNHALGDYSHASHFIILEKATDKFIDIIDPWTGTRKKISSKKLEESINDLRSHIKMCPLLFSIERNRFTEDKGDDLTITD